MYRAGSTIEVRTGLCSPSGSLVGSDSRRGASTMWVRRKSRTGAALRLRAPLKPF